MTLTQKLVVLGATLVAAFGMVMLAGVGIGFLEGTSKYAAGTDALLSILFGVVPLVGGAVAARRVFRDVAIDRRQADEATVLGVAAELATPITAVDVAARAGLPLARAQAALDRLHLAGHCEMDVSTTGVIVYRVGPGSTEFEIARALAPDPPPDLATAGGSAHDRIAGMIDVILRRFEEPDEVRRFEKGTFEIVHLGGMTFGRARYEPGWRWSEHVGPALGQERCGVEHLGLVLEGVATAAFADGRLVELRPGDLFHIPPDPHDSWVVGDAPYVSLHFLGAGQYAAK